MADFIKKVINYDVDPLFIRCNAVIMCSGETAAEAIRQ
jgi:hypothetical protein